jgi:hypothetical protein
LRLSVHSGKPIALKWHESATRKSRDVGTLDVRAILVPMMLVFAGCVNVFFRSQTGKKTGILSGWFVQMSHSKSLIYIEKSHCRSGIETGTLSL